MKIEDLESLITAATPGPWRWKVHGVDFIMGADNKCVLHGDVTISKEDARFIVQARELMTQLLEVVKAGRQVVMSDGMGTKELLDLEIALHELEKT